MLAAVLVPLVMYLQQLPLFEGWQPPEAVVWFRLRHLIAVPERGIKDAIFIANAAVGVGVFPDNRVTERII
jgi:hypothetical protein